MKFWISEGERTAGWRLELSDWPGACCALLKQGQERHSEGWACCDPLT